MTRFLDHVLSIWLHSPGALRLGSALLHFVWQGAVLAAIALLLSLTLRRAKPQVRYLVLLAAFFTMAACPIGTYWMLNAERAAVNHPEPISNEVPLVASTASPEIPATKPFEALPARPALPSAISPAPLVAIQRAPTDRLISIRGWLDPHRHWFVLVWLTGVCLLSMRLLIGLLGAHLARHRHVHPANADIQQVVARLARQMNVRPLVQVLESVLAEVPTLVGWLRPVILLPASAISGLTPAELESILAHELAHIRRHDYAINLLQNVIETILFYHPAIWWLSRLIRQEREHCCDDIAVAVCHDRLIYARALTTLAELRPAPRWAIAARGGSLLHRIRRIVGKPQTAESSKLTLLAIAAVIATVTFVMLPRCAKTAAQDKIKAIPTETSNPPPSQNVPLSQPAEPEARIFPTTISGRAIDEQGQPIEGATIYLVKTNSVEKILDQTTTNASGHYEFRDAPLESNGIGDWHEMAYFRVVGQAPGKAFAWRGMKNMYIDPAAAARAGMRPDFRGRPDPRPTGYVRGEKIELDLTFHPPQPITGRIVDDQGSPISGVKVTLLHGEFVDVTGKPINEHEGFRLWTWKYLKAPFVMPDQLYAVSDADGQFKLPSVPPGVVCNLGLSHPSYAVTSLYTSTAENPPETFYDNPVRKLPLEINLRTVHTIPIQITLSGTGEPAADVTLNANEVVVAKRLPSGDWSHGTSDKDGKLSLKLPPGKYKLTASPPEDIYYISTEQEITVGETPFEQPVTLKLQPGCLLILKAIDADSGQPVPGVYFWRRGDRRNLGWSHRSEPPTNELGEVRAVTFPGNGRYGFGANLPHGYRPADPQEDREGREIDLPAGETKEVVFKLRREAAENDDPTPKEEAEEPRRATDPPQRPANDAPADRKTTPPTTSKANLQRTKHDAEGRFTVTFDNPRTKPDAERWALDPEKHQVIFQVFVRNSDGKLVEKIFRQLSAREIGGYSTNVRVQPDLIDHSTVSVTFVTIQPQHDQWVQAFFHEGKGTTYKGIWSGDSRKLADTAVIDQTVGWLTEQEQQPQNPPPAPPPILPKAAPQDDGAATKPPTAPRKFEFRVVNNRGEPVVGAVVTPTGAGYTYEDFKCGDLDCGSLEKIRLNNGLDAGCMSLDAKLFPAFQNPPKTDAQGKVRIVISEEGVKQIMVETLRKVEITRLCVTIDHPNYPRFNSQTWLYEDEPFVLPDGVAVEIRARREGESRLASNIYPILGYEDISADVTEQDGLLTIRRIDLAKDAPHRWLRVVQVSDSEPPRFSEAVDLKQYTTSPIVLNLTLKPGARVAGRLSDNVPRPVKNGRVLAFQVRGTDYYTNWAWQTATDIAPDGSFVFPLLPPNEDLQLIALCDGWVSSAPLYATLASYQAEHGLPADLDLRVYRNPIKGAVYSRLYRLPAAGIQSVIPMEPTLSCEVKVIDQNNQPIAGASVLFQANQRWSNGGSQMIGHESDSLTDIRRQMAKEKVVSNPTDGPRANSLRQKTDANGLALISNLPACNFDDPGQPYEHYFRVGHKEFVPISDGTPSNAPWEPMLTAKITPGQTGKVTVHMQPK